MKIIEIIKKELKKKTQLIIFFTCALVTLISFIIVKIDADVNKNYTVQNYEIVDKYQLEGYYYIDIKNNQTKIKEHNVEYDEYNIVKIGDNHIVKIYSVMTYTMTLLFLLSLFIIGVQFLFFVINVVINIIEQKYGK